MTGETQYVQQQKMPQHPGNTRRGKRFEYLIGQRIEIWVELKDEKTEPEGQATESEWVQGDWMIARVQEVNENGSLLVQWPDKNKSENVIDPEYNQTYPVQKKVAVVENRTVTDMEGAETEIWELNDEESSRLTTTVNAEHTQTQTTQSHKEQSEGEEKEGGSSDSSNELW